MSEKIDVKKSAAAENNRIAAETRAMFRSRNIMTLNMISSPGSGKTSILEVLGKRLGAKLAVVTGDIQMTFDADRIAATGARAVQIETGGGCHLNAVQVRDHAAGMDLDGVEYMVIENIGNLVCPSGFDLGEELKVAVVSVTEGDEKPIKYPSLFTRAAAVVFNKMDLLPYVDFSIDRAEKDCRSLNSSIIPFHVSCKTGDGFEPFIAYLEKCRAALPGTEV